MDKKIIRLTESDLHNIVKESVNKVLTELDWKTYQNAAKKAHLRALDDYGGGIDGGKYDHDKYNGYLNKSSRFANAAEKAFDKEYGYDDGRYHLGLNSTRQGSKTRAPGGGVYPYYDTSKIKAGDRDSTYDWGGKKYERSIDLDMPFDRGNAPKTVRDKYDTAKQELRDYQRGNYDYQKGKGWQLKK
jgi:hypothetical protein